MLNSKKLKQNQLTELNNFLLQVKQSFKTDDISSIQDTVNLDKLPLQEILENNNRTTQKSDQQQIKIQSQIPSEEIQNLLQSLTTLLEKNLQESHNLFEIFQQNRQTNSKVDNTYSLKLQKEENLEQQEEEIKQNQIKLLQLQNQRLLNRIEQLNEQITQYEEELHGNKSEQRQLFSLINSSYCVQQVQYIVYRNNINILSQSQDDLIESGVFMIVDDQIMLSPSYIDENKMILDIKQIIDVTYINEFSIIIHYKEGSLKLIMENQSDFQKIDLLLWAVIRKSVCLNQDKIFENHLFERPFRQEISIDIKKLKDQLNNWVPQQENEVVKQQLLTFNLKGSEHIMDQQSQLQLQQQRNSNIQQQQSQLSPELKSNPPQNMKSSQINQQNKLQHALLQLKQGFCMIKYSEGQRKPNIKIIYLTENEQYIKWKEELEPFDQKNVSDKKSIQIISIKEVKDGAFGSGFEKFQKQRQGKESLGITIIGKRNLELDAPKQEIKDLFLDCLKTLLQNKQNYKIDQKSKK